MRERVMETMMELADMIRETDVWTVLRPNMFRMLGAAAGALIAWFSGLPAIAQALLIVQGADILTGFLAAVMGKSPKTETGKVSSKALTMGMIKKGLEWLVVLICVYVGAAVEMQGIAGAAMTYMMTAELVSLMENLNLFGLDVPVLHTMLDAAQKGQK
ncbi:MAG: phage holin family protein [Clostridia bacterium]|nr:phage holin family protein [Clostridia bacterium]